MATIREAVVEAIAFARETLGADRTAGIQLEEVESATINGSDVWLITLSMLVPPPPSDMLTGLGQGLAAALGGVGGSRGRVYKTFTVRKDTGEVLSMKIRELANA